MFEDLIEMDLFFRCSKDLIQTAIRAAKKIACVATWGVRKLPDALQYAQETVVDIVRWANSAK